MEGVFIEWNERSGAKDASINISYVPLPCLSRVPTLPKMQLYSQHTHTQVMSFGVIFPCSGCTKGFIQPFLKCGRELPMTCKHAALNTVSVTPYITNLADLVWNPPVTRLSLLLLRPRLVYTVHTCQQDILLSAHGSCLRSCSVSYSFQLPAFTYQTSCCTALFGCCCFVFLIVQTDIMQRLFYYLEKKTSNSIN